MDVTGVITALVGVTGTLGATALTQRSAARARSAEAESQRRDRAEERVAARQDTALAEKRAVYADLNSAARRYHSAAHDLLLDLRRGVDSDVAVIEDVRQRYRDLYARAQMLLPDRALAVASEVNLCLNHAYRVLRELDNGFDNSVTIEDLHEWYENPVSDGIWLLRRALREDLGVVEPNPDLDAGIKALRAARKARFDFWPSEAGTERPPAARSSADSIPETDPRP